MCLFFEKFVEIGLQHRTRRRLPEPAHTGIGRDINAKRQAASAQIFVIIEAKDQPSSAPMQNPS